MMNRKIDVIVTPHLTRSICRNCIIILVLLLLLPRSSAATSGADVALVAGGTLILSNVGASALTYSSLKVDIEMYIPPDDISNKEKELFYLSHPPAITRLAQASSSSSSTTLSLTNLKELYDKSPGLLSQLEKGNEGLKETVEWMSCKDTNILHGKPTYKAFKIREDVVQNVTAGLNIYWQRYNEAKADGKIDESERQKLSAIANQIISMARLYDNYYPRAFVQWACSELNHYATITMDEITTTGMLLGKQEVEFSWNDKTVFLKPKYGYVYKDDEFVFKKPASRNDLIDAIGISSNCIEALSKKPFGVSSKEKEKTVSNFIIDLDKALISLGIDSNIDDLKSDTPEELSEKLAKFSSLESIGRTLHQIEITFNGLNTSINTGPITNEVIQQIFTKGDLMGYAMNKGKWKSVNHAKSNVRTGDHNAIIYMDGLLTPIMKSSSFDPSQFIAANGLAYQKAFDVTAQLYGFPTTTNTTLPPDFQTPDSIPNMTLIKVRQVELEGQKKILGKSVVATCKLLREKDAQIKSQNATSDEVSATNELKKLLLSAATNLRSNLDIEKQTQTKGTQ